MHYTFFTSPEWPAKRIGRSCTARNIVGWPRREAPATPGSYPQIGKEGPELCSLCNFCSVSTAELLLCFLMGLECLHCRWFLRTDGVPWRSSKCVHLFRRAPAGWKISVTDNRRRMSRFTCMHPHGAFRRSPRCESIVCRKSSDNIRHRWGSKGFAEGRAISFVPNSQQWPPLPLRLLPPLPRYVADVSCLERRVGFRGSSHSDELSIRRSSTSPSLPRSPRSSAAPALAVVSPRFAWSSSRTPLAPSSATSRAPSASTIFWF